MTALDSVPTPARLFVRMAVATTLGAAVASVAIALLVPLALGDHYAAGALRLARAIAVGAVPLALLLTLDTVQRVRPIYAYLERIARSPGSAPPSGSAMRDAFAAPMRVALSFVGCLAAITLLDAVGLLESSGVAGASARARLDLAAWLVIMLTASPLRSGVERALGPWRGRIDAGDVFVQASHVLAPRSFADRLALRAAVPAWAATMLAATGAAAQVDSDAPLLVGLVLASVTGALAYGLARRTASRTAREVRDLAAYAHSLGPDAVDVRPPVAPTDRASAELHDAFVALAVRLAAVRGNEERAHRTMAEAQRLKTQFLASMSHDLRSPLNSILGFSEVLLGGLDGPLLDPQRESVREIQRAGEDLLRLLTEVLDSARLDAGRLELRCAWTPSVEILTEAVRRGRVIVGGRAQSGGHALVIDAQLEPGLPPVYVDSERIVQAVVGLFGHAARAMDGGTIRLRARVTRRTAEAPAMVRVEVTDTGGGIPESERERIFGAFHGVRGGRRLAGLGLTLGLARGLVRAHGGDVSVASAADGTTFTVALPTDGPPPSDPAPRRVPRPVSR